MFFDLPPMPPVMEMIQPEQVYHRRSHVVRRHAVGTAIILDNGVNCVVAGYDGNGNVICYKS